MPRRPVHQSDNGAGGHVRVQIAHANLVDHLEVAHVDVHVGFDGQLARGAHDGEPGGHRARAACEALRSVTRAKTRVERRRQRTGADEPASVEDQDAAARLVKGQLHGRKAPRRVVGIRAARANRVKVEGQLEPRPRDGDGLCELPMQQQQQQHSLRQLQVCANEFKGAQQTVTTLTSRGVRWSTLS